MRIDLRNDKGILVVSGGSMEECAKHLIDKCAAYEMIINRMREIKEHDIEAEPGENIKQAISRALKIAGNNPDMPIKLLHNDTILTVWADASRDALYQAWFAQQMPMKGS